jgi:hypothetical protein
VTIDILERLAFLHSPKSQERALEIPSNKKWPEWLLYDRSPSRSHNRSAFICLPLLKELMVKLYEIIIDLLNPTPSTIPFPLDPVSVGVHSAPGTMTWKEEIFDMWRPVVWISTQRRSIGFNMDKTKYQKLGFHSGLWVQGSRPVGTVLRCPQLFWVYGPWFITSAAPGSGWTCKFLGCASHNNCITNSEAETQWAML